MWRETEQGDIQNLFDRVLTQSSFKCISVSCCTFVLELIRSASIRKITHPALPKHAAPL